LPQAHSVTVDTKDAEYSILVTGLPQKEVENSLPVEQALNPVVCEGKYTIADRLCGAISSLRCRLIMLVVVALIPAFGLTLYNNIDSQDISKTIAFAPAPITLALYLAGLGIVAVSGMAMAWVGSELYVWRQARVILAATQKLRAGDLSVRTGLADKYGELGQLAHAFDTMAESLQQSDRRRNWAEATLRGREKQYRSVVNNLKEVLFQTDETGYWTFLNPAWTEITGFTLAESIGRNIWDYIHPDDKERSECEFQALISREKEHICSEVRCLTKACCDYHTSQMMGQGTRDWGRLGPPLPEGAEIDGDGSYRWIEVHARLIFAPDGTIIGTSGTLIDITKRKLALVERDRLFEQLQREREDLAALSTVTANAVSTLNLEQLLNVLLLRIAEVTHADTAVILLVDNSDLPEELPPRLCVRASIGLDEELRSCFSVAIGEGFAGTIAATMQPLYLEDAQNNQLISSPAIKSRGIRSMMGVPLKRHGKLVGVLHVDWCSVYPHNERVLHLLEITAERCTMAILNAQLYETTKQLQEHLQLQIDRMPIACILQDKDFRAFDWNPAATKIFGWGKAEVLGQFLPDLIVPTAARPQVDKILQRLKAGDMQANSVNENVTKAGRRIICEWHNTPLKQADGSIIGFLSMVQDVTQKQQAEQELRESERRYHTLAKVVPVGIFRTNAVGDCIYVNERWCDLTGLTLEASLGEGWRESVHPEDKEYVLQTWYQAITDNSLLQLEYRVHRADKSIFWVFCQAKAEISKNGEVSGYVGTIVDISDRVLAEEQLRQRTFYDALTALPNRVLFAERLQSAITKRLLTDNSLFAILLLDLERFQIVKYSLGHRVAEQLLVVSAEKLGMCLRPQDTLARVGSDEFAILLPDIESLEEAIAIAECIHQEMKSPFELDGCEVFSTTNIGIVSGSLSYDNPEDFLQAADTALHHAKRLGKGRHVVFHPAMHYGAVERLQLETDLLRAIERQQFQVCYQPIVSIVTGKLTGFEALVRWYHPTKGLISPTEFIPLAEETGLIGWIDRWVLREACRQMRLWQEELSTPLSVTMSVNLSGLQLSQLGLIERIDRIIQETGVHGKNLKLEITESVMMGNTAFEINMLQQLKSLGIKLSIDDFGTGYSSLARLHQLPIDTLKIDRSFVNRMGVDHDSLEIVRTIITLAHRLDMDVIAEGVETEAHLSELASMECEYGQGYLFSEPVSSEIALKLIQEFG
jgi:diguanylate cyclase (GGDEF)-like protein/PAS domain S-box-containing protein